MLSPLLAMFLTCCLMSTAHATEHDPVVRCISRPPLHDGKLHIPINGFAFYTCEIESHDNTSYERESWYLKINGVLQNFPEIALTASTQGNEPCLFSNSTCDRMIALIVPTTYGLDNMTVQGCAVVNKTRSYKHFCSTSGFTIEIKEEASDVTTTNSPAVQTIQSSKTTDPNTETEMTSTTVQTTSQSIDGTRAQSATDILGLTANGVSMYNLLTNSIQIILLIALVFKSICGCSCNNKQKHRLTSDVEGGSSRQDQVEDSQAMSPGRGNVILRRLSSLPSPSRRTSIQQQIRESLIPNDEQGDEPHYDNEDNNIVQARRGTPISETTENTGSQTSVPEYVTQNSLLLSNGSESD